MSTSLSNLETVLNSIVHDWQIYRWFSFLIGKPNVKAQILKNAASSQKLYRSLFLIRTSHTIILITLFYALYTYLLSANISFLICTIILSGLAIFIHLQKKKMVMRISEGLLKPDFANRQFEKKSLYQIGEVYAREFQAPSLVAVVHTLDGICFKTFIGAFIVSCFIFVLNPIQIIVFTCSIFFLIIMVFHLPFIYKRIH